MDRNQISANDELLVKYLLGEADALERQMAIDWINAHPDNERYFAQFNFIWDESRQLACNTTLDENAAWERFAARAQQAEQAPPVANKIPLRPGLWAKAAAVLAIIALGSWLAWFLFAPPKGDLLLVSSGNNTLIDTLPDGSVITLNKNSSISYPAAFTARIRSVKLTGEAFFSIAHDKAKPFIIDAGTASIKVVGTTFNVKTTVAKTEIIVESGIVEVSKNEKAIRLIKNQKAIVTSEGAEPEIEHNTDMLYNYYRTNEFVCDNTPLWKLTEILNEAFGVSIYIATPEARDMPLTVTFQHEQLEDILKVVATTLNLQVERNGRNITLK